MHQALPSGMISGGKGISRMGRDSVFDYNLELNMPFTVMLDSPEVISPVPEGIRANFYDSR